MGMDFADELTALGHEVRTFAYRRENALYKNKPTKALYTRVLLGRLQRVAEEWRPAVVLVIKGGPIKPDIVHRLRGALDVVVVNFFPDNPLWMIPFECIEAYDFFFTKERYALRMLQQAGLTNVHYVPMYCVPGEHHPVALTDDDRRRYESRLSFVGSRYPYRERFVRSLSAYPLRLWGGGWVRSRDPDVRKLVAGPAVFGRDIVGVNTRTFELAAAAACQVVDFKDDLATLFKPGDEVVAYRDLGECRRVLDHYLAHPDEARAIGENARRRALAEHTLRHRLEEMIGTIERRL